MFDNKSELLKVFCTALMLFAVMNIGMVGAKPIDPTEGYVEDSDEVGDWNWGIRATVGGYWVWLWMRRPPEFIYEWLCHAGQRWGGLGVWYVDIMIVEVVSDKYNYNGYTTGPDWATCHDEEAPYHFGKTRARSWFENWIGQSWLAITDWAEI